MRSKYKHLVLLRWLLTLAVAYLIALTPETTLNLQLALIGALGLTNVALMLAGDKLWRHRALVPLLVVFDTGILSTALFVSGAAGQDFLIAYFVILAIVALGRGNMRWATLGAAVLVTAYAFVLYLRSEAGFLMTSAVLLRLPFLLVVGSFYAGLTEVAQARSNEARIHRNLLGWVGKLTATFASEFEASQLIRQVLSDIDRVFAVPVRASLVRVQADRLKVLASSDDEDVRDLVLEPSRYPELVAAVDTEQPTIINENLDEQGVRELDGPGETVPFSSVLLCPAELSDDPPTHLVLRIARRKGKFTEEEVDTCAQLATATTVVFKQAELRTTAEKTERLQIVNQIAETVSTNFNDILSNILLSEEILRRELEDETSVVSASLDDATRGVWRDRLDRIVSATNEGLTLVERLSSWTRLLQDDAGGRSGHGSQHLVPRSVFREAWRYAEPELIKRQTTRELEVHWKLEDAPSVLGNSTEIREALLNLVLNALDAMPRGGTLTLGISHEDDMVEFSVRDTGIGIPDELREQIFEPMVTTKGSSGTGMGLSVVRSVARRYGGEVAVDSAEGFGSCFRLRLPVAPAVMHAVDGAPSESAPEDTGREETEIEDHRVLLVEGNQFVRDVMVRFLEGSGYTVDTVADSDEANVFLDTGRQYSCVLVQAEAGGSEAVAMLEHLGSSHPDLARRTLLYSAGEPSQILRDRLLEIGANHVDRGTGLAAIAGAIEHVIAPAQVDEEAEALSA